MSNSMKLPISVCMLVKNEEENLLKSLPSLSVFEEILVYDSGSTDNSQLICQQHGVKIIEGDWHGFSRTRTKLFSQACQPWVFWLDADEIVTDQLIDELQAIYKSEIKVNGFLINRMVFFQGKWVRHGEWFPDWNLRIFRADFWEIKDYEVHESIDLTGKSFRLSGIIEHYSYKNWADRNNRVESYSTLWAEMKKREGKQTLHGEGFIRAAWRFFRSYFIKLGFMDGLIGLRVAISIAREVLLKYRKLSLLNSR